MLAAMLALSLLGATEKPKLAVLDVQAVGVAQEAAVALGDSMTQELARRGFFDVISSSDIRALLGVERQKQLLGCEESSCTAELSGALGARFVLQSSLTRLGSTLQLSVQMMDTSKAQTVARAVRLAADVKALAAQLPWALAEATATPAPPAPSRALPWTLIGVGALAFAGGGVLGIDALSRERAMRAEFEKQGETGIYRTRQTYQDELDAISRNKSVALLGLAVGTVAMGLGVGLYPREGPGGRLALLPTGNGAALVGVWP